MRLLKLFILLFVLQFGLQVDLLGQGQFNYTTLKPQTNPLQEVEIYSMSDFPAPVGGVITLATNTKYIIKSPLVTADRFLIQTGSNNIFASSFEAQNTLTYLGALTLFTGSNFGRFEINGLDIFNVGTGTFVELDGLGLALGAQFDITRATIAGFANPGICENIVGFWFRSDFANNLSAITIKGGRYGILSHGFFNTSLIGNTFMEILKSDIPTSMSISSGAMFALPTESIFYIDPAIDPTSLITININGGTAGGNYYRPGVIGTFASTQSATINGVISAFADNGSGGTTVTDVAHGLFNNQQSIISGTTNYDGTYEAFNVTANTFDINAPFVVDDATGTWNSPSLQVNSTAHGLSEGTSVLITKTIFYNGGYVIYNALANSFQINATPSLSQSGNWDTGSLTQKDNRVNATDNFGQPDSKANGCAFTEGNVAETVISTQNVWVNFNMGSLAQEASNIERFTLLSPITGDLRYDGIEPFSGKIIYNVSGFSAGGSQEFHFRAVKNGSVLPDPIETAITIGAETLSATLIVPVTLVNGDVIRPQVENADGTSNIVISKWSSCTEE